VAKASPRARYGRLCLLARSRDAELLKKKTQKLREEEAEANLAQITAVAAAAAAVTEVTAQEARQLASSKSQQTCKPEQTKNGPTQPSSQKMAVRVNFSSI